MLVTTIFIHIMISVEGGERALLNVHLRGENDDGEDCILSTHSISCEIFELILKVGKIHVNEKLYRITDSYMAIDVQYPTLLFVEEIQ